MTGYSAKQWAFLLARITLGINLLIHGLVRLPKLSAFANGIVKDYQDSILPEFLITIFGYGLPFIETLLGLFLLLGYKTKHSSIGTGFLIVVLIFGSALQENWQLVSSQMVYAIFIFLLISNLEHNVFSIDKTSQTKIDGFKT